MTTVVVGAARGIGEAVARRLATESWAGKVVLADLLIDETESVASDLAKAGHDVEAIAVDLRDDASIASLVERTREADKVALVAGIFKPFPSLEVTRADLERILSVNTFGTFMVAQGYAREMVERGEGSIVAIGSIAARMPRMRQAAYCASKAAMRQALRVLALETVPRGVRINFVAPGPADTEMMRALQQDHSMADLWRGSSGRLPAADPGSPSGPARGRRRRRRVPPLPGRQPRVVPRPLCRRRREPRTVTERPALAGITPILATPYREDGRIAIDDIERQVDHLAGLAVTAIGIGFGSDILRLTDAERDGLVRAVAAAADGRRPVLASAGANSLRAALDRAAATRDAGADILMVTPPGASSSPTPAGLADYYRTIATEIGLPVVVQDAPALTGTPMSAALLAGLGRDIPGMAAIKIETMPPAPKVGDVVALPHGPAAILGGAGGIDFYHELERGADGTVPGVAMAELFVAVAARHASSDRAGARRLFNRYLPASRHRGSRWRHVLRGPARDPCQARHRDEDRDPAAVRRRPAACR